MSQGRDIRATRISKGIDQRALACELDVSVKTISRLENGQLVDEETIIAIAQWLQRGGDRRVTAEIVASLKDQESTAKLRASRKCSRVTGSSVVHNTAPACNCDSCRLGSEFGLKRVALRRRQF